MIRQVAHNQPHAPKLSGSLGSLEVIGDKGQTSTHVQGILNKHECQVSAQGLKYEMARCKV